MELLILSDTMRVKRSNEIYKVRTGQYGAEWIGWPRHMPGCVVGFALIQTLRRMLFRLANVSAVIPYYVLNNKGGKSVVNQEELKPESGLRAGAAEAPH